MFLDKLKTDDLNLSEWNGDRLADLIEQHMLREELFWLFVISISEANGKLAKVFE
jgi:hypothetical protein